MPNQRMGNLMLPSSTINSCKNTGVALCSAVVHTGTYVLYAIDLTIA